MTREEYGTNKLIIRYDDPTNLVDLFENTVKKYPKNLCIGEKDENGDFQWVTYEELASRVDNLRGGLANLEILKKDDSIGIIADNRAEWAICAFATYGLNCRWIPMYEKELMQTWKYIIEDSSIKVLFVSKQDIYNQVRVFIDEIPTLEQIFVIDGTGDHSMDHLEKIGKNAPVESKKPDVHDIAGLIYTSGTTGDPKGVLLSHGNFTSNAQAGYRIYPNLTVTARALSILPWAHSYAQTAELYNFFQFGGSIGITSVDTMSADLQKANPTHLMCVPRLFNKIYDGIHKVMEEEGGMKKKLFDAAKMAAQKKRETGKSSLKFKVLDKLVFSKVRARFGTRMIESLTASAKTEREIANFFYDIGLPIYDCYGMTETSPAITMNTKSAHKLGSVGKPIEKVKIVIDKSVVEEGAKDGEILVYGPNIMHGYHNKPEQTAAIMVEDENGNKGVRTGDRGRIDEDGFLFITGRIKNEYKLLNGKYVHPASIEQYIKLLPWVANVMLYGDGRAYNVCLIVLDREYLAHYKKQENLPEDVDTLMNSQEIREMVKEEIKAHMKGKFGGYEIPKKFQFLAEDFTLENGMLTQTMKLKRKNVLQKYQSMINTMYDTDAY
ncbi:long-chain fatty acid--CoA ligase [Candidatus Lokiarchaeum ossiferum]|uniref:long-chain fatty acid--CoA ligase n=1 Tax=Candidatus Lokiarchaeum ossiferum TaxID=2951803 RepID=UPI00352FD61C